MPKSPRDSREPRSVLRARLRLDLERHGLSGERCEHLARLLAVIAEDLSADDCERILAGVAAAHVEEPSSDLEGGESAASLCLLRDLSDELSKLEESAKLLSAYLVQLQSAYGIRIDPTLH